MSDYEYIVDDRYQTQEAIRTISISFQPHLPFTEAYSMTLMNQGGSSDHTPVGSKSNYFRLGPKDTPGSSQDGGEGDYPMRHKREIYRSQGSVFPRLVKMSKSQNREKNVLKATPNTGPAVDSVSRQLASLLNVDPTRTYKNPQQHTPMSSRDQNELELRMIAEGFDNIANTPGGDGQNLNKNFSPKFTDRMGKGFDIDLSKYTQLKGGIAQIMGSDFNEDINDLEVSTGQKPLLQIKNSEKLTNANKSRWEKSMNAKIEKYNKFIRDAYNTQTVGSVNSRPQGVDAFDLGRFVTTTAGDTNTSSVNYNVRQFLDRFIRNKMKPYYFEAALGPDRFGLVEIRPTMNSARVPQFAMGAAKVITTHADLKAYMAEFMKTTSTLGAAEIQEVMDSAYTYAHTQTMLTEANIATLGKHAQAHIVLNATNGLDVTISQVDPLNPNNRGHGYGQVFKVQNFVAKKLLADLTEYFSTNTMKGQFAHVYNMLLQESNKLTRSWFSASSHLRGKVTFQPLSTEFMYGKAWNGPRKKYLGVWSSPTEDTWRGNDEGYNFSISPMMESRRQMSNSKLFTDSYD